MRTFAAAAVTVCLATGVARADSKTEARAEALFQEAKALRAAGRYPEACAEFEASRRLDEGIGVTLYLADCYEHEGDRRRALSEFRRAEALAVARGDPRAAVAHQRAEALDRPIEASAPPVAASTAAPPANAPAVAANAAPHVATQGAGPPASTGVAEPQAPNKEAVVTSHATQRRIGIGLAGAGVAGIGVGAVFGVLALSRLSQSNHGPCDPSDHCTFSGLELRQRSADAAVVSTVSFAAGATLLAAGVTVYLTAPHDRTLALAPAVTAGGAGAVFEGRF